MISAEAPSWESAGAKNCGMCRFPRIVVIVSITSPAAT
jgi:hypothetical protein